MATVHRLYPLPFMDGHPLDESEWNKVLLLLDQVNRPKAKVLSAVYREHVTTAWRNYLRVYEEAYAQIEELNRRVDEQREGYEQDIKYYMTMLQERETFWEDRIREPRDEYMRLSVAVAAIPGAWTEELTRSVHGPREYLAAIQAIGQREESDGGEERNPHSNEQTANRASASSQNDNASADSPVQQGEAMQQTHEPPANAKPQEAIRAEGQQLEVLTKEEVADENQLPTFAEPPIPRWFVLVFTALLGLLAGYLLCVATGFAEPTFEAVSLAALGTSAVLYGIWSTARSAAAVASDAFHLHWSQTRAKKLRTMVWVFFLTAFATLIIQAAWLVFLTLNTGPDGLFAGAEAATAGYLLWLLWPWYLLIAGIDGFLRGRGEALGNRIRAEITRAQRVEASLRAPRGTESLSWPAMNQRQSIAPVEARSSTAFSAGTSGSPGNAEGAPPIDTDSAAGEAAPSESTAELLMRYRRARAAYESLRRQRDLDLAFIGKRIKDMQSFLSATHYVPSRHEQHRIEMARTDYERICAWFLRQLADALRDVGGGVSAGEIIRRFTDQFGRAIPTETDENADIKPIGGLA